MSARPEDVERTAREGFDRAHAADPELAQGQPGEVAYADRLERWVGALVTEPSLALRLAARAQHLERWAIPRSDFPEGRSGYLRWRGAVHARQGDRAREIVVGAGADDRLTERVAGLVAKRLPLADPEAQALEDAACLVFLETQLEEFSRKHARAKVVDVIRKTWRKMSPGGQQAAGTLALPGDLPELIREATS